MKEKSTIFLMVWFIWAAGQDLDLIVRHSLKSDYYIFSNYNLEVLFFLFAFAIFFLNITTVFYLFRPKLFGYYTAFSALILAAIQNTIALALAVNDLPGVRDTYEKGREVRGMTVRKEAMDMIFTPNAMYTSIVVMLVFYVVISYFVFKNKGYFYEATNKA